MIYARFSDGVRAFDRDMMRSPACRARCATSKPTSEFTYQAQIIPGWTVQPVVTRVWHPNGDASRNALVTGVRSVWRY